jgi:hypothetical protein
VRDRVLVTFTPVSVGRGFVLELSPAMDFNFFQLDGMTWVEWVSVLGVVVTAVGFIITWIQLHRTRTAGEARVETITEINQESANDRLRDLLPQFRKHYDKAQAAIQSNDAAKLRKTLEMWSANCERSIAMLTASEVRRWKRDKRHDGERPDDIVLLFRSTQGMVGEALHLLESSHANDCAAPTKLARDRMRQCADKVDGLLERRSHLRKVS